MQKAGQITILLSIWLIVASVGFASDKPISFQHGIKIILKADSTVIRGRVREIKPTGIAVYSKKEGSRFYFKDQIDQVYYREVPSWNTGMLCAFLGLFVGGLIGYAIDGLGNEDPENTPFGQQPVESDGTNMVLIVGCAVGAALISGGLGSSIGEYKKVDPQSVFDQNKRIFDFGLMNVDQSIYLTVQVGF